MSITRILPCVATILLACVSCRQEDVRTAEIQVPQMRDAAAAGRVRSGLGTLRSGLRTEALVFDLTNGTVTVAYDSMILGLKNIEHAIADAGFDANELKGRTNAAAAPADTAAPAPR